MIAAGSIREAGLSEPAAPKLRLHHGYKSWTSTWYDSKGHHRTKRFGKQSKINAAQARARFNHWKQTEYDRHEHAREFEACEYKIADLATDYLAWAKKTFVKNGVNTSHIWQVAYAMEALRAHHEHSPAAAMTAPKLADLRDAMQYGVGAAGKLRVRSIKTVNGRLDIIKNAFQWARERDRVPAATVADVLLVKRLRPGRCDAKPAVPVMPVDETMMRDTLTHCSPTVEAMILVQWHTGMRPGEVCIIRPCDLKMSGKVWHYHPMTHKMEHKKRQRVIAIGPQAQAVIRPFLKRELSAFLFSPAESVKFHRGERHKARKTPMNTGNTPGSRQNDKPQWMPADHYNEQTYRKAIRHACKRAGISPAWKPNQLRHAWATRVRDEHGAEAASDGLSHGSLNTTLIYAERSQRRADEVAMKIG